MQKRWKTILIILFLILITQTNYSQLEENTQIDIPEQINNQIKKKINVDSIIRVVLEEVNDTIKL